MIRRHSKMEEDRREGDMRQWRNGQRDVTSLLLKVDKKDEPRNMGALWKPQKEKEELQSFQK